MTVLASPSPRLSELLDLLMQKSEAKPQPDRLVLTIDGRTALHLALRIFSKKQHGKRWLLPAYCCPSVIQTFRDAKVDVEFYPIEKNFQPCLSVLQDKLIASHAIEGILFIHYFGFFSDWSPLKSLLTSRNVHVIEDCAHLLMPHDFHVGNIEGQAQIYSLRKWYPISEGGALVLRENDNYSTLLSEGRNSNLYKSTLRQCMYALEGSFPFDIRGWILSFPTVQRYLDSRDTFKKSSDVAMHQKTVAFVRNHTPPYKVMKARHRENYSFFSRAFEGSTHFVPLKPTMQDVECPFMFPLLVQRGNRDAILTRCLRKGIGVRVCWQFLIDQIMKDDAFSVSHEISKKILCLPIHYQLEREQLEGISTTMTAIS